MSVKKIDLFRGKAEIQKSLIQSVFIHNRGDAKVEKKIFTCFWHSLTAIRQRKCVSSCKISLDSAVCHILNILICQQSVSVVNGSVKGETICKVN